MRGLAGQGARLRQPILRVGRDGARLVAEIGCRSRCLITIGRHGAEQPIRLPIRVMRSAVPIGDHDPDRHRVQELGQPTLAVPQGALDLLLGRHVGDHQTDDGRPLHVQAAGGQHHRKRAVRAGQVHLHPRPFDRRHRQQRGKQRPVGTDQQVGERRADQTGRATPEHLAQPGIRVQDDAARRDRRRAFVHLFDDQPVGPVGAAEGVDLLGPRFATDHRVDAAQPDRFQDIPKIADLVPQRPVLRVDQLVGDLRHGLPVPGRRPGGAHGIGLDLQRLPHPVRVGEVADQAPHRFGPAL